MGSKGSGPTVQNTAQTYMANPAIQGAGIQAIQGAQAAAAQPFQMPVAPVAGMTPDTMSAFQQYRDLTGPNSYLNRGASYTDKSAQPLSADDINQFYNPMAANVTAQMQNIFGQQNVQNAGTLAARAGGVGADRIAVGMGNLANQQGLAAGQTYADLYQRALQAAQQWRQMQAGAGAQFGQYEQGALGATGALNTAGQQQQRQQQLEMNAPYQQRLAQIAYPFQTAQYLAGITGGLAPAFGGSTTGTQVTTPPQPSIYSQLLGLGTAGVGLMGAGGLFGGAGATGSFGPSAGPITYGGPSGPTPFFAEGGAVDEYADGGMTSGLLPYSGSAAPTPADPTTSNQPLGSAFQTPTALTGSGGTSTPQPTSQASTPLGGAFQTLATQPQAPQTPQAPPAPPAGVSAAPPSLATTPAWGQAKSAGPLTSPQASGGLAQQIAQLIQQYSGTSGAAMPSVYGGAKGSAVSAGGLARGFADGGGTDDPSSDGSQPPPVPGVSIPKTGGASPIPYISMPMGGGHSGQWAGQGVQFSQPQQSGSGGSGGGIGDAVKLAASVLPFLMARGGSVQGYEDGGGPLPDTGDIDMNYKTFGARAKEAFAPFPNAGTPQPFSTLMHQPSKVATDDAEETPKVPIAPTGVTPPEQVTPTMMPQTSKPYPDATERDTGQDMVRSPWMGLVKAGATMAATPGPLGVAMAKGIQAGVGGLESQRKELRSEQELNDKAQELFQKAQAHLDQYSRMTPAQQADVLLRNKEMDQSAAGTPAGGAKLTGPVYNNIMKYVHDNAQMLGLDTKEKVDAEIDRQINLWRQRQAKMAGVAIPGATAGPAIGAEQPFTDKSGKTVIGVWNGTTWVPKGQ